MNKTERSALQLTKRCEKFSKENLRAPSWALVTKWGRILGLPLELIKQVSDRLYLRHRLGK
jgi:hypothetical protein